LGFNWEVSEFYTEFGEFHDRSGIKFRNQDRLMNGVISTISASTVALALKWFRDEKKIRSSINQVLLLGKQSEQYTFSYNKTYGCQYGINNFDTYELAESALLDELLTILEKEK